MTRRTYDPEAINAAHHATPIFAANQWHYGRPDQRIPDTEDIARCIQHLVDTVRAVNIETTDGYGDTHMTSGRFFVSRSIQEYTYDEPDDEISISLQLADFPTNHGEDTA